jgi:hypothetical protein
VHLEITGLAVLISKHKTMTRIARESSSVKRATKKKKATTPYRRFFQRVHTTDRCADLQLFSSILNTSYFVLCYLLFFLLTFFSFFNPSIVLFIALMSPLFCI